MVVSPEREVKNSKISEPVPVNPHEASMPQENKSRGIFHRFKLLAVVAVGIAFFFATKSKFPSQITADRESVARLWPDRGQLMLQKCQHYSAPFVCGWVGAPLDYTNEDDPRNASIAVVIYAAGGGNTPAEEVLGSLFLNPGGPGVSGVEFVGEGKWYNESLVAHLDAVLGHKYHLIGFDPRGTGNSYPGTNCFAGDDKLEKELAYYSALAAGGFPGHNAEDRQDFEIGALLAQKKLLAQVCADSEDAELLQFMSTPFVARDLQLMHRAVGDEKLNYWGFSYGTVIGSTFADMFPSEVGHVVLDGVIEMPDYYSGRWWTNLQDIDEEFKHFFDECEQSGSCSLKSLSPGPGRLMETVVAWLTGLKAEPGFASMSNSTKSKQFVPPQVVTYSSVMLTFFEVLREPLKWPALADAIYSAMAHQDYSKLARPADPGEESEEYYAISCSDSLTPPGEFGIDEYKAHSKPLLQDSSWFGDLFSPSGVMCTGIWPIRAAERYHGNFTSKTSFPLLMLGNDLDPVTPGKCADDLAASFPNAVSVRRAGYGHCSFSQPSKCIDDVVADYFLRGILPDRNTRCEVDQPIFD